MQLDARSSSSIEGRPSGWWPQRFPGPRLGTGASYRPGVLTELPPGAQASALPRSSATGDCHSRTFTKCRSNRSPGLPAKDHSERVICVKVRPVLSPSALGAPAGVCASRERRRLKDALCFPVVVKSVASGSLALSPASAPLHDLRRVAPAPGAFLLSSEHPLPLQGSVRMEKKAATCCFSFFQTLCCSELPAWRRFHIRELNPRRLYQWVCSVQVQAVSRERGQPTGPGGGLPGSSPPRNPSE